MPPVSAVARVSKRRAHATPSHARDRTSTSSSLLPIGLDGFVTATVARLESAGKMAPASELDPGFRTIG